MSDTLEDLFRAIDEHRHRPPESSRTARLVGQGVPKMAQKLGEEGVEVAIDAVRGDRDGVVRESADLLYHLTVLWWAMGVTPEEVWSELRRREALYGIAEKAAKDEPGRDSGR